MSGALVRTCLYENWKQNGDTNARRDVPLLSTVVESHDLVGTDARLALAGAYCEAETLRDNCTEVWQLLNLLYRQWRGDVGKGSLELGSQNSEDPWCGKNMNGHNLGVKSAFTR